MKKKKQETIGDFLIRMGMDEDSLKEMKKQFKKTDRYMKARKKETHRIVTPLFKIHKNGLFVKAKP